MGSPGKDKVGVEAVSESVAPSTSDFAFNPAIERLTAEQRPDGTATDPVVWRAPAPAKVNLFLHITGRRADGYHELQTVFEFVELADELTFTLTESDQIVLDTTFDDVEPQHNLVVQAAQALRQATGYTGGGCRITLSKRIPSGAGLGGGSSDAATTLVVLNKLWGTGLSAEALIKIATLLGADVPVFVAGSACWADGIGDRLRPIDLAASWYVLVSPGIHITTADVFGDPQLTRNCSTITIADFENGHTGNVCEAVAFRRFPEVARIHALMQRCAEEMEPATNTAGVKAESGNGCFDDGLSLPVVRMTGTGSCVFARCLSRKQASNLYTKVLSGLAEPVNPVWSKGQQVWMTAGCSVSPLYAVRRAGDTGK